LNKEEGRGRERKRERGREGGRERDVGRKWSNIPLKVTPPITSLPSCKPHILKIPSSPK
jgi:hypothetical protein